MFRVNIANSLVLKCSKAKKKWSKSVSGSVPGPAAYGDAFEHFIILEIQRLASYAQKNWTYSYFQTKEGNEIDLIISLDRRTEILIEIKSTTQIIPSDFNYLNQLSSEFNAKKI